MTPDQRRTLERGVGGYVPFDGCLWTAIRAALTHVDALTEENARLRAALEFVRDDHLKPLSTTHYHHWSESWQESHDTALGRIVAALAGKGDGT
jgi:hypothetical protein